MKTTWVSAIINSVNNAKKSRGNEEQHITGLAESSSAGDGSVRPYREVPSNNPKIGETSVMVKWRKMAGPGL